MFCIEKLQIIDYFNLTIFISVKCQKTYEQDEQTLEELNSSHRRLQAKCQLVKTSYIKLLLFLP